MCLAFKINVFLSSSLVNLEGTGFKRLNGINLFRLVKIKRLCGLWKSLPFTGLTYNMIHPHSDRCQALTWTKRGNKLVPRENLEKQSSDRAAECDREGPKAVSGSLCFTDSRSGLQGGTLSFLAVSNISKEAWGWLVMQPHWLHTKMKAQ